MLKVILYKKTSIFLCIFIINIYAMESDAKKMCSDTTCYFCHLNKASDEEHFIVHRAQYWLIQMRANTILRGHLNLISCRHVAKMAELTSEEIVELAEITQLCITILKEENHLEGINWCYQQGETAGAQVPGHLHIQIASRSLVDAGAILMLANTRIHIRDYKILYPRFKELFLKHSSEKQLQEA